ncbi:MAG: hypothetical protein U9Q38_08140, partial [Thermodesulfobacteriota bacterium]|nr:hypothetical protein [Thermodesulfobacteriota bacterium]
LLPSLLKEFKEKRDSLPAMFQPLVQKYYKKMNWEYPESAHESAHESALTSRPLITVQGGIGNHGEALRLTEKYNMDLTGWASPFLLVPEATCVDDSTRELLKQAGEEELYLSDISPIGIPFNNIRNSGSEIWTNKQAAKAKPGSMCPKGFLVSNTEFTEQPICLASSEYQKKKLEEINNADFSFNEKERLCQAVVRKTCICDHLASGALITLGIALEKNSPQSICPGPNIAWFDRLYTLPKMVDHIYGRCPSLVSSRRPHMFANEIVMYVDYFEKLACRTVYTLSEIKTLQEFNKNLEEGMDLCLEIAEEKPYPGENLDSIPVCVKKQRKRLRSIYAIFANNAGIKPEKHETSAQVMMALYSN